MRSDGDDRDTATRTLIDDNADYAKTKRSRVAGKSDKLPDDRIEDEHFSESP